MVQMTAFAAVMAAALFAQAMSLGGLVLVSTVLQATAVMNVPLGSASGKDISAYGVSPYMLMSLVAGLVWLWRLGQSRSFLLPQHLRWPLGFLLAYLVLAALGAWVLPMWFAGMQVNLLLDKFGLNSLAILRPTLSNMVQPVNLLIHVVVLLFLLQAAQRPDGSRGIKAGVIGALVLVLAIGFYEQWALLSELKEFTSSLPFWVNNAGYELASVAGRWFWFRVGVPFSEPSYASAYLAATTLGLWAIVFFGKAWWWACAAALLSTLGLLNTLGATGLASAGLAFVALLIWAIANALRRSTVKSVRLRAAIMCFLLVVALIGGYKTYSISSIKPKIDGMFSELILTRVKEKDGVRQLSNKRALEIVQETYGLGVGMGSNRASSFMASLVSNTGVLGALLFCSMLASLMWRYIKAPKLTDMQIFVATALPTATLAMSLGIPDLNLPMYWGFIFLAFIFCPEPTPSPSQS